MSETRTFQHNLGQVDGLDITMWRDTEILIPIDITFLNKDTIAVTGDFKNGDRIAIANGQWVFSQTIGTKDHE